VSGVQKNAEQAFLEGNARLLDLTNDATLMRDASDRITFWNKGATDMYGFSREEAIGRVTHDLFRTEFPQPLESIKDILLRDGQWAGELRHTCRTGARKTVSSRWVIERDASGNICSILESNRDVTEAKRAEEAQNRLAAIVESSDDAIVSKGLDGIITSWNNAAERMFGYTASEAVGQHITLIIPSNRRDEETLIIEKIRKGERVEHFDTIRVCKDKTLLDISLTISPVRDATGKIVGASKIAHDITQRKRIEQQLRESEERYRTLVDALDSQVQFRTLELERRNLELRELSARLLESQDVERRHIARELHDSAGQTLAALGMGLAQLAADAKDNPAQLDKDIEYAERLVRHLNQEIRTTSYLLHPPLLDDAGLLSALEWYVQGLKERSGLDVTLRIPDKFERLAAEMELVIFRIVQESLTNVHRHSTSKTASIRVFRDADRIVVEVQDQGCGMSPERLAKIQSQGTGVGISGMRERLRHFDGELLVESNAMGTKILAILPLKPASAREQALALRNSEVA
jgi:PAS domain S-box-containing protein